MAGPVFRSDDLSLSRSISHVQLMSQPDSIASILKTVRGNELRERKSVARKRKEGDGMVAQGFVEDLTSFNFIN